SPGNEWYGAAADEGIEHEAAGGTAGEEARLDERFGKNGEVRVAEFGKRNGPDGSLVASERMKGLIPAAVVQIIAAAVLADLRRAAADAKMPPTAAHAAVFGEGHVRLADRVGVVVVIFGLGKEEDILVVGGGARFCRAGHRVRLLPDAVGPQIPAVVDEGERDAPRQAELRAVVVFVADDEPQS